MKARVNNTLHILKGIPVGTFDRESLPPTVVGPKLGASPSGPATFFIESERN